MRGLHLDVASSDKEIFNGEVDSITLPSTFRSFAIPSKRAPIVSSLKAGVLFYVTKSGKEHVQDIHGGLTETNSSKVSACVD